eukprot:7268290-Heterocapsa_arctica.AAC.1
MTRICGAEKKVSPLRRLQEMETAFTLVLEEAGNSLDTKSDKSFMTMRTDFGAHTCSMMLTSLNL